MKLVFLCWVLLAVCSALYAQPGLAEMRQASSQIRAYYFSLSDLCMVLAALFSLLGGYRVYHNWQLGRHHIDGQVIAWFISCLFALLIRAYLDGLLGL